jgi:hypothetical protein
MTQKERDMLTVIKWVIEHGGEITWAGVYLTGGAGDSLSLMFRNRAEDFATAAEWVRQQHPPQAKEPT